MLSEHAKVIGFTVADPCDELLIVKVVDALGKVDMDQVVKSWLLINVVPEDACIGEPGNSSDAFHMGRPCAKVLREENGPDRQNKEGIVGIRYLCNSIGLERSV
jgi:hypothetical protein